MASEDKKPRPTFEYQTEPFLDKLDRKFRENPFVPVGLVVTLTTLFLGLRAMKRNDKYASQVLMRARVVAQGLTVGAAVLGMIYYPTSRLRNKQNPDAQSRMSGGDIDAPK